MKLKIRGFTLIEILAVIAIISILIALFSPALRSAREQANIDKTKAMIASLEVAINMYYTDLGSYPDESNWGTVLAEGSGNYGPYMDKKDYESGNFKDPWGGVYIYNKAPTQGNTTSFNLEDGSGKDIKNWYEEE